MPRGILFSSFRSSIRPFVCTLVRMFVSSFPTDPPLQGDGPVGNECKTALTELLHFIKANPVSISLWLVN